MRAILPALFVFCASLSGALMSPEYTAQDVLNSASLLPGALAPYTFATIKGRNLAWAERAISNEDIRGNMLPVDLGGVSVFVAGFPAYMWYVSPAQVNFLIPPGLRAPEVKIRLSRDGMSGPEVKVKFAEEAPALFQTEEFAIATHLDWSRVTKENPAVPGELIVLFANGLGTLRPPAIPGEIPGRAAWLENRHAFRVLLNGTEVDPGRVEYAGIVPTCAGLYQINVRLPESLPSNPEIRVSTGGQVSPPGVFLATRGASSAQ